MNKEEAMQMMAKGYQMTHPTFTALEWVTMQIGTNIVVTEEGYKMASGEFWSYRRNEAFDKDWSRWERKIIVEIEGKKYLKVNPTYHRSMGMFNHLSMNLRGKPLVDTSEFSSLKLEEYRLIVKKKSNLSSSERKYITQQFNKHFKLINNESE
jgi:hypothetical protein